MFLGSVHILNWEVRSCILFQRAVRGSQAFSNMADILTEVMHQYSKGGKGGLTCNWRIRDLSLHFILNTFSNKTYSNGQVNISKLYKRVTARSYSLNRFDGTMMVLQYTLGGA